ncbi:MAG TPA: hypothetical protein VFA45_05960 [Actinomycetes bacterium]|jgi:hypothetical protein|nr:hypothetical protein [Actinomycetes bacterium]
MGLDVYVGPLTRYYAAPERRIADQRRADPDHIRNVIVAWRLLLSAGLGRHLDWNEDSGAPHYTDRVGFAPYTGLQVLAAAVDRGESELGGDGPLPDVHLDHPVWRAAAGGPSPRFPHLYFSDLWLPCNFSDTLTSVDPFGERVTVGSSVRLLAELQEVHRHTGDPSQGGSFARAGRCGLAILLDLVEKSVTERLPMCFHY